ncbi:MAG: transporter [Chloroflexi bacterium]|nr:transporter [Chloroflexota bacterium]
MGKVAVVGIGLHPWGKFDDKTITDMAVEATNRALKDASLEWSDIQEVVAGEWIWGAGTGLNLGAALTTVMGQTGIPTMNVFNMCATATNVFRAAYNVVASGQKDIVLAISGDKSPKGFFTWMGHTPDSMDTDYLRWKTMGLTNPGYWAMECRRRMEKYGTTPRHLALAKVVCSRHGALNPDALYKKVFTVEEVLNSPMVCDPLRLFMICATRDGAAAAILCSEEVAKKYTTKPVWIAGVGEGSSLFGDPTPVLGLLCAQYPGSAPLVSESYASSQMAYKMAGIGPKDMDFAEIPDNSSWHYLQYPETLGFWEAGQTDRMLDEEATLLGGKLPLNPSGGIASFGEAVAATGLAQIYELVVQLRGQAGARQVKGAKVGIAQTYGQLGNSATAIMNV